MKEFKFLLFFIWSLFTSFACSTSSSGLSPQKDLEISQGLTKADLLMKDHNYEGALSIYNQFLKENPGTQHEFIIKYNSGVAYEELKQCESAKDRYQQVTQYSGENFDSIKSYAFYRLGYMYECLGKTEQAIAAWIDARKSKGGIASEVLLGELPARLSLAYSRLGQTEEATRYFNEAIEGLKQIRKQKNLYQEQVTLLSKTLFSMGRLDNFTKNIFSLKELITTLSMAQVFLLKSIEMNDDLWSIRSEEQVFKMYEFIWHEIQNKDNSSGEAWKRAVQTLETLSKLKAIRFPDKNESRRVSLFFENIDKIQNKFQIWVQSNGYGNDLTLEARKNENLKKEGQNINPNPQSKKNKRRP